MTSAVSALSFYIPSKTFLMGEYAVLHGGPALVMAHAPRFSVKIQADANGAVEGLHPMSPAGQWVRQNMAKFSGVKMSFVDPFAGKGGFGASSAQFVGAYAWSQLPPGRWHEYAVNPEDLWRAYKSLNHGTGQPPSGADVTAQALGGVTIFQSSPFMAKSMAWPFENLVVVLARTGEKLPTHEHLRERLPVSDHLIALSRMGTSAFAEGRAQDFINSFRAYGEELERLQLVTMNTRGLIAQAASDRSVIAVKGCGAMGADVLAVLCDRENLGAVERMLGAMNLEVVSNSDRVEQGLTLEARLAPRLEPAEGPSWA
jgi:mevalonate kinase